MRRHHHIKREGFFGIIEYWFRVGLIPTPPFPPTPKELKKIRTLAYKRKANAERRIEFNKFKKAMRP